MKKSLILLIILILPTILISCKNEKFNIKNTKTLNAKLIYNNLDNFENIKYENGYLTKKDINKIAYFETKTIEINNFEELVTSFNILNDNNTSVSIKLAIGNDNTFSDYYIMALWQDKYKSSFNNIEDEYAKVNIDTLMPKIDVNKIKIKVEFNETNSITKFENITLTTKTNGIRVMHKNKLIEKELNVLPYNQLSIDKIGNLICSPTSLSMVLNYYDINITPIEVSEKVFDMNSKIYGNWTINASFAASFKDIKSKVEYIDDFDKVIDYIKKDIPVIMSIKTNSKNDLKNSIMPYPYGHLIVLTGFKKINNIWYAIVNDPAEYSDDKVLRYYDIDELFNVWSGYTYIIYK